MNLLHEFVVLLAKTHKQASDLARRFGKQPPQEGVAGSVIAFSHKGKFHAVVYIEAKENKDPIELANTIAHESVHAFQRYCWWIEEHNPSSEFQAYGIGAIVGEVTRQWRGNK